MEITLFRVVVPPPRIAIDERDSSVNHVDQLRIDAEEYLTAIAAELRAKGLRVDTQVRVGDNAVEEILAGARDVGADLIAMTTHGRGGLGRLLFGSVAEAVLRQADIPVFLMRQTKAQVAARAAWEAVR